MTTDPKTVQCPTCGAKAGFLCIPIRMGGPVRISGFDGCGAHEARFLSVDRSQAEVVCEVQS